MLGINLRPILIPGHVFLKNDQRNIETTLDGKNISDENIAGLLHLDFAKTKFTPASRDQFISALYSNACLIAANKGKAQEGLKYCDKAIKLNAGNGEAFINKSFIELSIGDFESSLKNAQQGVKLYPQLAHAYFTLGNTYRKFKKINEAKEAFIKAISIRSDVYRFHYNLGNVYLEQNQNSKAIESFSEAIRLNPEYAEAYTNRAIAYTMTEKYLPAIKDYDFLLKKNPQNFNILFEKRSRLFYAQEVFPCFERV
jgi:tetratricopeptide (TPR) repeat protein